MQYIIAKLPVIINKFVILTTKKLILSGKMYKLITTVLAIIVLLHDNTHAQNKPEVSFQSPLDTALYLSAPFGSLRDNHFHSGMDIRTFEKEGLPVYAVADGFVSRIKVSPFGYGKALYINHPNGYTSVYAHLQNYYGEIAEYIKSYQYQIKSFAFDNFPGSNTLRVQKGQLIGYTGNTGGSTGPHLHFEIRNTKTEEPMNPLLFGITAIDSLPPFIKRVVFYDVSQNRPVIVFNKSISSQNTLNTDSGYLLIDTLHIDASKIGVGIEAYDYLVNTTKEYSLYSAKIEIKNTPIFSFQMNKFSFSDTKYINAHIDFETYKTQNYRISKCFLDDGNKGKIYPINKNKGLFTIDSTTYTPIKLSVSDFYNNVFTLFAIVKSTGKTIQPETPCSTSSFYPQKENVIQTNNFKLTIPPDALYDTLVPCLQYELPPIKGALSNLYQIHNNHTPLHKAISISIRYNNSLYTDKVLLASVSKTNKLIPAGGAYKDGWVTLHTSNFGTYTIIMDTVAPKVKILQLTKDSTIKDTLKMQIEISDNESGIDAYNVYLNNKWLLTEYDAKNNLLTYYFDNNTLYDNKQELHIIVEDKKGNKTDVKANIKFLRTFP